MPHKLLSTDYINSILVLFKYQDKQIYDILVWSTITYDLRKVIIYLKLNNYQNKYK